VWSAVYVVPPNVGIVSFDALLAHPKGPLAAVVVLNIDKYMGPSFFHT
jgi:hypothetical protein